jgi:hypothetical protein
VSAHSVPQRIYAAAGSPDIDGLEAHEGDCFLCGAAMTYGVPAKFPPTFMDYDKARAPHSTHICDGCAFTLVERSVELQEITGKDKPQRMRNYSHVVLGGAWRPLSKAQKRETYEALLQNPEVAVIAVSGQKHLCFRAQPGWWQVEEQAMRPDPQRLTEIMAIVQALYDAGFGKGEIESGQYAPYRIMRCGLEIWEPLEEAARPHRGSALFELAVYLVQKNEGGSDGGDTGDDAARTRGRSGLRHLAGDRRGLQTELCQGDLGAVPGAVAGDGADDGQSGGVLQPRLL